MTFYCKNFDCNANRCMMLKTECVPGRPGCVLAGKVKFSEEIEARLTDLAGKPAASRRGADGRLLKEEAGAGRRRRKRPGD